MCVASFWKKACVPAVLIFHGTNVAKSSKIMHKIFMVIICHIIIFPTEKKNILMVAEEILVVLFIIYFKRE